METCVHQDSPDCRLAGQIDHITFFNEENGYTVAKVNVSGRREPVTVVGTLMAPMAGEFIEMKGQWKTHPKFGPQFHIVEYRSKVPATIDGIKKYLSSGLIPGLGPKIAERIVASFGRETLEVINQDLPRLKTVAGVGQKRIESIKKAWDEQQQVRKMMVFLASHGVSSAYAAKIIKHYGNDAVAVVTQNPYRLAADIHGVGFVTADNIAFKLGMEKESPLRVGAGILYVLNQMADDGHVYFPYDPLIEKCREILDVERDHIASALGAISADGKVVLEDLNQDLDHFVANNKAVYLAPFHLCESRLARYLAQLLKHPGKFFTLDAARQVSWVQKLLGLTLAPRQAEAVSVSLKHKVLVITGGPGTGKTTIVKAILKIFLKFNLTCLLAAPTGRAAKRLSETTGHPAKTIHRLLQYSFSRGGFQKNAKNRLKCDLLVIDEASMIDTVLAYHLLKAVASDTVLILVGDVHQLPSVGPGNVLLDIIASKKVPVVTLEQIFRQAARSRIVVNAHKINQGILPLEKPSANQTGKQDFFFIEQNDPQRVLDIIVALVAERIPKRFGLNAMEDIQVLAPMNRGELGTVNLNLKLRAALNPAGEELNRGDRIYRVGDKIMQIRNNYDKEIYNGDIGRIRRFCWEEKQLWAGFENREVHYEFSELDEISPAYAVSVHKSQGSEYPAVVIPVLPQHYLLLQRNLIYTAVTRGKVVTVLVGSKKALAMAVKNNRTKERYTYLKQRLKEQIQGGLSDLFLP